MKVNGYIQPISETAQMWQQLSAAKLIGDRAEIGRLSAEIRNVTQRHERADIQRHSSGPVGNNPDSSRVVDG